MSERMKILVTGGNGFIGSAVVRHLINQTDHEVVNVDKMTYAATEGSTESVADSPRLTFEEGDICDSDRMTEIFTEHSPDAVMHLAAESHVDRSIDGPAAFIHTNVIGTFTMLETARAAGVERFHHVSTDEVFGSLVTDRPGHDHRYAIDQTKIQRELGWEPKHTFDTGLRATVQWYLDNQAWWLPLRDRQATERVGLKT